VAGGGERRFDFAGHRRVEAREHELRRAARCGRLDSQPRHIVRKRRRQPPRARVAVGLALGALAGAKPGDPEPRVLREQGDELLANHPGGAEDPDFELLRSSHDESPPKTKKPTRRKPCRLCDGSIWTYEASEFDHTTSDTSGPLSTRAFACVRDRLHERQSIAW